MDDQHRRRTLRVLLVGEGNLSFAHALVRRLSASLFFRRWRDVDAAPTDGGTQCTVLATTFDSAEELMDRYPEVGPILEYFASKSRVDVRYLGNVNATDLEATLSRGGHPLFDPHLVVFNNPHIGFEDLYRQRSLISHFFASVRAMPAALAGKTSEDALPRLVVVALCDDQPRRWGMMAAAARNGLVCVAAIPVLAGEYSEYENKRHQRDTKFPYNVMVQYYFADATDARVRELVTAVLPAIFETWPSLEPRVTPTGGGQTVNLTDWREATALALSLFGAAVSPGTAPRGRGDVTLPVLHQDVLDRCQEAKAVAAQSSRPLTHSLRALEVCACLPLLHPRLFNSASEELHCGAPATHSSAAAQPVSEEKRKEGRNKFSPYVDLRCLAPLYRLQAAIEAAAAQEASTPLPSEGIPPTLDEGVLGRPLTQRESVKLARYLEKARRRSSTGAGRHKGTASPQAGDACRDGEGDSAAWWQCPYCRSSGEGEESEQRRVFHSQSGYDHHILTKHSGVAQLKPTMHARVHTQILTEGEADEELGKLFGAQLRLDGDRAVSERYCAVCDLLFITTAAYKEHLAFLSPQLTQFVCPDCEEHRLFPDERALQQHRILKHAPAPSSIAPLS